MLLDDRSQVDLDDILGVRRALDALPEDLRDDFVEEWYELTQSSDYEVAAIHAAVTREMRRRTLRDGYESPMTAAWRHIGEAMTRYLAWNVAS